MTQVNIPQPKPTSIRMPTELHHMIESFAKRQQRSLNSVMCMALYNSITEWTENPDKFFSFLEKQTED
jgi:predicted DNA-binding protein